MKTVGRYVESDPIGLIGGMSTHAYVNGNPLWHSDMRGLATDVLSPPWRPRRPIPWGRILGQAGKAAGRFVPGLGLVILAYDVCSVVDDYLEKKKCEEANEACFEECEHLLGQGGRTNQGQPYRNCWIKCMKAKGCYKGDMAVE
jgi:hypothetical protein